jgi:hypothetical protein
MENKMSQPHAESKRRKGHRKAAEILAQRGSSNRATARRGTPSKAAEEESGTALSRVMMPRSRKTERLLNLGDSAENWRDHAGRIGKRSELNQNQSGQSGAAYRLTEALGKSSIKSFPDAPQ